MGFKVMGARKKFNVKFPDLYASKDNPDAEAFNCVQRGHQNTLEVKRVGSVSCWCAMYNLIYQCSGCLSGQGYPAYIILQALSALEYPAASAGLGM